VAYLHERDGDPVTAAWLYPERDHLTRQAARLNAQLSGERRARPRRSFAPQGLIQADSATVSRRPTAAASWWKQVPSSPLSMINSGCRLLV
jgi:hypothetical protein